jgi:hypothetical protein
MKLSYIRSKVLSDGKAKVKEVEQSARDLAAWAIANIDKKGETYKDVEDNTVRGLYLGSIFNNTPSGKFYLPFACSNVDACNICGGRGCGYCGHLGSREAFLDQIYQETLEEALEAGGLYYTSGEGSGEDMFAEKVIKSAFDDDGEAETADA